jgi:hypothetical protein
MENIVLSASDLASKWGFNDGDLFYEEMLNYIRNYSFLSDNYEFHENSELFTYSNYFDQRKLLLFIVVNNFGKYFDDNKRFGLERVLTSHNPIRAFHHFINVDSSSEDYDNALLDLEFFLSNIKVIEIDEKTINKACSVLFPMRSNAWLAFFNMLHYNSEALSEFMKKDFNSNHKYINIINSTQSTFFIELTDKITAGYDELSIQLTAELLYNSDLDDLNYKNIFDTLNQCKDLIYK